MPVCNLEPVKPGEDPVGVVVYPDKLVVGFRVGDVRYAGYRGGGHIW